MLPQPVYFAPSSPPLQQVLQHVHVQQERSRTPTGPVLFVQQELLQKQVQTTVLVLLERSGTEHHVIAVVKVLQVSQVLSSAHHARRVTPPLEVVPSVCVLPVVCGLGTMPIMVNVCLVPLEPIKTEMLGLVWIVREVM